MKQVLFSLGILSIFAQVDAMNYNGAVFDGPLTAIGVGAFQQTIAVMAIPDTVAALGELAVPRNPFALGATNNNRIVNDNGVIANNHIFNDNGVIANNHIVNYNARNFPNHDFDNRDFRAR